MDEFSSKSNLFSHSQELNSECASNGLVGDVSFENKLYQQQLEDDHENDCVVSSRNSFAPPFVDNVEFDKNSQFDENESYGMGSMRNEMASVPKLPDISKKQQLEMLYQRKYIDKLKNELARRHSTVDRCRESLQQCCNHLNELEIERSCFQEQILAADDAKNITTSNRLKAQMKRCVKELEAEQELDVSLRTALDEAETAWHKTELEYAQYVLAEKDLEQDEENLADQRWAAAVIRDEKEMRKARGAYKRIKSEIAIHQNGYDKAISARERQKSDMIASQRKAHSFFENTVSEIKAQKCKEDNMETTEFNKRVHSTLTLKRDITQIKENLSALRNRDRARENERSAAETRERELLKCQGRNPDMELLVKNRLNKLADEQRKCHDTQRQREVEIAQKIVCEQDSMKKKERLYPELFKSKSTEKSKVVRPHKKKPLKLLQEDSPLFDPGCTTADPTKYRDTFSDSDEDQGIEPDDGGTGDVGSTAVDAETADGFCLPTASAPEQSIIAQPEFDGLWDETSASPPKVTLSTEITRAEQAETSWPLEGHYPRAQKQVAGGKVFSGTAFYSKPSLIHFKDLEVGKTYKQRVQITNVSYTINSCRLISLSESLKDFITIDFSPPGHISAGMTCDMVVTFKPMINQGLRNRQINEDIEGEIRFATVTGPFNIPVRCSKKKCELSVDRCKVDFETSVIGESLHQTVKLTNDGQLGTRFRLSKLNLCKQETTALVTEVAHPDEEQSAHQSLVPEQPSSQIDAISTAEPSQMNLEETVVENPDSVKTEEVIEESDNDILRSMDGFRIVKSELREPMVAEVCGGNGLIQHRSIAPTVESSQYVTEMSGEIGPASVIYFTFIWQPLVPGKWDADFTIEFDDPLSEMINIHTTGNAIDVPVWVERQNVDLRICMIDRLYQDSILINNRATSALKITVDMPKQMVGHLEILPRTGYIQARSQFSVQLKFLPRASIYDDALDFIDPETQVMEVPITLRVAGQTRPVEFAVHAVVTGTDLSFDRTDIDFACATIHESVRTTVYLTNDSLLPQQFGFVNMPEYIEAQPNDGFGTILARETIPIDLIFSPNKADEYQFTITCKTLINREFTLNCKGVGVLTPLELDKQVINFAATALYDSAETCVWIRNTHTSANEFTHPVPRIGKGAIARVCPTSYEFYVPDEVPISIYPAVGTLKPGEKARLSVRFEPRLAEADVRAEAVNSWRRLTERRLDEEYRIAVERERERLMEVWNAQLAEETAKSAKSKKKAAATGKDKTMPDPPEPEVPRPSMPPAPDENDIHNEEVEHEEVVDDEVEQIAEIPIEDEIEVAREIETICAAGNEEETWKRAAKRGGVKFRLDKWAQTSFSWRDGASTAVGDVAGEAEQSARTARWRPPTQRSLIDAFPTYPRPHRIVHKRPDEDASAQFIEEHLRLFEFDFSELDRSPLFQHSTMRIRTHFHTAHSSVEYITALSQMRRRFNGSFVSFVIPCYIASSACGKPGQLDYSSISSVYMLVAASVENTLWLEVHCPARRPELVVISDAGRTTIDFGDVMVGKTVNKAFTLQNIAEKTLPIKASILDTLGPFEILNAFRSIEAEGTHLTNICFSPSTADYFHEALRIGTGTSTLHVQLCGRGVQPDVRLSCDDCVQFAPVLPGDVAERVVSIENKSALAVEFDCTMDSGRGALNDDTQITAGARNYNGLTVFDCTPCKGTLGPGEKCDLKLSFAPDHPSAVFNDILSVRLFGQIDVARVVVRGRCSHGSVFVSGCEPTRADVETLGVVESVPERLCLSQNTRTDAFQAPKQYLVALRVCSTDSGGGKLKAIRQISFGCVAPSAVQGAKKESKAKAGEFIFEGVPNLTAKGFAVEPARGSVESGQEKKVTISWTPPADYKGDWTEPVTTNVQMKGETGTETIALLLRACVT